MLKVQDNTNCSTAGPIADHRLQCISVNCKGFNLVSFQVESLLTVNIRVTALRRFPSRDSKTIHGFEGVRRETSGGVCRIRCFNLQPISFQWMYAEVREETDWQETAKLPE